MKVDKIIRAALQHYQSGDLEQAKYFCKEVLKKQPDNTDMLYLLGVICAQLQDYDSAMQYLKRTLEIDTKNVNAYFALGTLFQQKGLFDEAINVFQRTLALNPDFLDACYYLAQIFLEKKQVDDAIIYLRKAQQIDPSNSQLCYRLGLLLHEKGKFDDAIDNYQKATEINPDFIDAFNGLGNTFQEKREFDRAISSYQKAITIDSSNPTAYINIGTTYHNMGKFDEAIASFQYALSLNPRLVDAYYYMGTSLERNGKLKEALESYQAALQIVPDSAIALVGVGSILAKQGKVDEADIFFRRAVEAHPHDIIAYKNFLMNMLYNARYDGISIFTEHRRFADQCITPISFPARRYSTVPISQRKLRVGYVSPDFKRHPVAFFIEPALICHNRDQFDIFLYSAAEFADTTTERFKRYTDNFRDIMKISDEKAAELIHRDAVDILVDLAGYTQNGRTLLFNYKPAPVQVSWIGYPATTGLPSTDYKIVDHYTDPPGMSEKFYSETLLRMPDCFLCYKPFEDSPEIKDLPALRKNYISFGSFNNFSKISPINYSMWSDILNRVPNSRLIIKTLSLSDQIARNHAREMFAKRGIRGERIELLPFSPSMKDHLNVYNEIDIALDTFPYNGTTTTCEALWMGVPVITLAGNTHVSRVGMSLLKNVALSDLTATTPDEYIAIALNLAHNPGTLQSLHNGMRERFLRSPLTDAKKFVEHLEGCYKEMWDRWCKTLH